MTEGPVYTHENFNHVVYSEGSGSITPAVSGVYFIGFHAYSDADQYGIFIDDFALAQTLGIDDLAVPESFKMSPAFPNPFNPVTTIEYSVPQASEVNIQIYNIMGQNVVTLLNKNQFPGSYRIQWHAENQPSGIYFAVMHAGDFTEKRKLILLK